MGPDDREFAIQVRCAGLSQVRRDRCGILVGSAANPESAYRFSLDEFDAFARESVSRYGLFLDALGNIVDPKLLRVCSVFPSALVEARWAERFLAAHRGTPENDRHLATELQRTEIPDLATRNRLRALYNSHLRCLCEGRGLVFVDDFPPVLDSNGISG